MTQDKVTYDRDFKDNAAKQGMVMDIKHIPTEEGWDYLAVVIDL